MELKVYKAFTGYYHYKVTLEDGTEHTSRQYTEHNDAANAFMDMMQVINKVNGKANNE